MVTIIEILASITPFVVIYHQLRAMAKENITSSDVKWHFGK